MIGDLLWNDGGSSSVQMNEQTHHIYNRPIGIRTITFILGIKDGITGSAQLVIDEILPASFNTDDVSNPMDLTFVSAVGNGNYTIGPGDNDQQIAITSNTDPVAFVVTKVVIEVEANSNCSIWHWRVTVPAASGFLYLYNVII